MVIDQGWVLILSDAGDLGWSVWGGAHRGTPVRPHLAGGGLPRGRGMPQAHGSGHMWQRHMRERRWWNLAGRH